VSRNSGKGSIFGALSGIVSLFLVQSVLTFPGEWFDLLDGAVILAVLVIIRLVSGKAAD